MQSQLRGDHESQLEKDEIATEIRRRKCQNLSLIVSKC